MKVNVAAIQMVSSKDMEENLIVAAKLIQQAAEQGAELIVLPENFALLGRTNMFAEGQEEAEGLAPIQKFLSEQARLTQAYIVGGTLPIAPTSNNISSERVYAACCVFNPEGNCTTRYDKSHLFDVKVSDSVGAYQESRSFIPGDRPQTAITPWGTMGLAVCYDLRFPEYFRLLVDAGAKLIALPAAFTYQTGEAHWEVLLRARAIETQSFVIAANQGGRHSKKRATWGHTMIIDPWGQIIGLLEKDEGVVMASIDMDDVDRYRQSMPLMEHRRF